jgi:hypothetical protein
MEKINKQETLEEAKERILNSNYMNLNDADIFEMGAKWQQEQDKNKFSEEDMKQFAFECVGNFLSNNNNMIERQLIDVIIDRNNNQFEQFKNK